jgi:putative ABC transport system permease protein
LVKNGEEISVRHLHTDESFVPLLGLKVLEGRNLNEKLASDRESACLINRTLADRLGFIDPVGRKIPFEYGDLKNPVVVGVLEDFYFQSPKYEKENLVVYLSPQYPFQEVLIKMPKEYSVAQITQIEHAFSEIYDPLPFDFNWVEDQNRQQYKAEIRIQRTAIIGTVIALILVMFGLISVLGTYIKQRMKEIVIRKINGSRPLDLFFLLIKRFSIWLILGFILGAWPAYYFLQVWLEGYPLRIDLGYEGALVGFGICFLVLLLTLSLHMQKVNRVNPVYYLNKD